MFPRIAVVHSVLFLLVFLASTRCAGGQLFLTPLIARNELALAKNLSRVGPLEGYNVPMSYSGFLTVNETTESNLFFWFFPALVSVYINYLIGSFFSHHEFGHPSLC